LILLEGRVPLRWRACRPPPVPSTDRQHREPRVDRRADGGHRASAGSRGCGRIRSARRTL